MAKNKQPHPLAIQLQHEAMRLYGTRKNGRIDSFPLTCIVRAAMREAPEVLQAFEATSLPHVVLTLSGCSIDEITLNDYQEPEPDPVRVLIKRCEENDS